MFDELENSGDGVGEQEAQQMPQEEVPIEDFGSGDEMNDFLDDAPIPDDQEPISTPKTMDSQQLSENGMEEEEGNEEEESKKGEEEDDESPLEPTHLGNAIDSLMMHWCQLLTNVSVKAPIPPPSTLDHVKEVAEVCSKHFRDASVDVNNEFTRLGIQWEMEQYQEQSVIEESNLDEAIKRQNELLEQARGLLKVRMETFNKECPNAGKQFTT